MRVFNRGLARMGSWLLGVVLVFARDFTDCVDFGSGDFHPRALGVWVVGLGVGLFWRGDL